MNDILSFCINGVKYSRTNDVYVILKSLDVWLWSEPTGKNASTGDKASNHNKLKYELYSFRYNIGADGSKYYPILMAPIGSTYFDGMSIKWVSEKDIERFEVIGGVIKTFYFTVINALHHFSTRKAVVVC